MGVGEQLLDKLLESLYHVHDRWSAYMREGTPHTHLRPPECSSLLEEGTYTRAASVGMEMNEMNGERARRHMESVRS